MSEQKLKSTIPFEGEAITRFRVYPKQMDNLLFTFCILAQRADRWVGDTAVRSTNNPHYWEEVSQGATMTIYDKSVGCVRYLDSEQLMQGIRRWIESGEGNIHNGQIEVDYDEVIADRIVQYALFEEVRYE